MRRDFTQLLTLIRAHALLHQRHRKRDGHGRIVATLDDYAVVYDIVQPVFAASLSAGLTPEVRATVEAVAKLATTETTVTVTEIARRLSLSPSATWRRIRGALGGRWLVNDETRKYQPAKIRVGEPMPEVPGLPSPAELVQTCKRTPQAIVEQVDERLHERLQAEGLHIPGQADTTQKPGETSHDSGTLLCPADPGSEASPPMGGTRYAKQKWEQLEFPMETGLAPRACPKGHPMTHLVGSPADREWVCPTCCPAAVSAP